MERIDLFEKRRKQLLKSLVTSKSKFSEIEDILLQRGAEIGVEEKVVSIGFALIITLTISSLLALFGVAGFIVSLVLFGLGFVISRVFAKKVYGKPRKDSDLSPSERKLLIQATKARDQLGLLQAQINQQSELMIFGRYQQKLKPLRLLSEELRAHDKSNLAWRYQKHFSRMQETYQQHLSTLTDCYAPKKRK
jgi:hypothetical protein